MTPEERPKANQLYLSLNWIVSQINAGNRDYKTLEKQASEQIEGVGFRADYISVCNSKTLQMAADDDQDITVLGAMYTSGARLIDNISLN